MVSLLFVSCHVSECNVHMTPILDRSLISTQQQVTTLGSMVFHETHDPYRCHYEDIMFFGVLCITIMWWFLPYAQGSNKDHMATVDLCLAFHNYFQ